MQIRDYDFVNNIDVLFEKKIVIHGAGEYGKKMAMLLEDAAVGFDCFCDKDESKGQYLNHPVITLDELKEKTDRKDCMVIVSSINNCEEMIEELAAREIAAYICTWYGLQAGIELHVNDEHFSTSFHEIFLHRKKVYTFHWPQFYINRWYMDLCHLPHAIWVYQPAKVGSSTVCKILQEEKMEFLHMHHLAPVMKEGELNEMHSCLLNQYKAEGVKIITLVREPIARALSYFMEGFYPTFIIRPCYNSHDLAASASKYMKEEVLDTNQEFLWFDEELREVTGIDIYQYPFNKEKGYTWIKEGNIEILVLKMEKLNENIAVIGEFIGKPHTELQISNVGEEKYFKYIYKELKEKIKIPAEVLDSQYKDNKYVDHFYTEEEKMQFWEKWNKHVLDEKRSE